MQVKGLVGIDHNTFASCSRDGSVCTWQRDGAGFVQVSVFKQHHGFVNSLTFLVPSGDYPSGLIVSGGQDKLIYAFDPFTAEVVYTLVGHEDNVCALSSSNGLIISGSWDKYMLYNFRTAKVWKDGVCIYTLRGHQAAIWGVICPAPNTFITASADKTIKIWNGPKEGKILTGHGDVVRALVAIPHGFASCSNDSSLRLWTLDGQLIGELYGHTLFAYSVACLPNGDIISSGEDRTARIWRGIF